jgi:hypothetical protein
MESSPEEYDTVKIIRNIRTAIRLKYDLKYCILRIRAGYS